MSNKNLGDLVEYLGEVAKEGGNNMKLTVEDAKVVDFESFIDVDHVKDTVNISSNLCVVKIEQNSEEPTMITKAFDALNASVIDYGWQITSLVLNENIAKVMLSEEGIILEKTYNIETDNWE